MPLLPVELDDLIVQLSSDDLKLCATTTLILESSCADILNHTPTDILDLVDIGKLWVTRGTRFGMEVRILVDGKVQCMQPRSDLRKVISDMILKLPVFSVHSSQLLSY
jgi:hypothetical protein